MDNFVKKRKSSDLPDKDAKETKEDQSKNPEKKKSFKAKKGTAN